MEFERILRARRMVRNYQLRPVEPAQLERILHIAARAPSAGNSQGVSWVVVQSESTRRQIAALAQEPKWIARGYPAWLSRAPVHIVLCAEPRVYHRRYAAQDKHGSVSSQDWPVPYWYVDAGCCLMLILQAAVEQGLAAGFQGIQNLPGLAPLLGIPDDVQPLGVITLGYPAPDPEGVSRRLPARERTHWEKWSATTPS